jgi:hypothetical protein
VLQKPPLAAKSTWTDINGVVSRDNRGHIKYAPVLQILDTNMRHEFSAAVIAALLVYAPNAFNTGY